MSWELNREAERERGGRERKKEERKENDMK
jgi:hypothetical protein